MKVNRLGKTILERGYKTVGEFAKFNNIGVRNETLVDWCKEPRTIYSKNMVYIDRIAEALEVTHNEVLNMISTKATYESDDITNKYKSPLRSLREQTGYSAEEFAEYIGEKGARIITDIESGRRIKFSSPANLDNYLKALNLSFTEFRKYQNEILENMKTDDSRDDVPFIPDDVKEDDIQPEAPEAPIVVVPLPEVGATPVGYETKPVEPSKVHDEVMKLIYGQVNYETFLAVSDAIRRAGL